MNSPALNNAALLVGRVLLSAIFIMSGLSKLSAYDGTVAYMASAGVPGWLLPVVIILEVAGGLALIAGFQTRLVAVPLAGFTLIAGFLFHFNFGDQMQAINFMKNISMAGGFLALFAAGPGSYSLDARRG
jgi:putative oxidoreductase